MYSQAKTCSILFMVRHGECLGNILRKNMSPDQSILTDRGKLQAKLLGNFLRDEKFTMANASDYSRAVETAEIILAQQSNTYRQMTLDTNAKLRERHLGIFEGEDYAKVMDHIENSGQYAMDWSPEGGETREDIELRIKNYLQEIFTKVDKSDEAQTILAVSHSGFILHFLKYTSETPDSYFLKNWSPDYFKACANTGYFKIAIQKNPLPDEPRELEILVAHGNEHLKELNGDNELYKLVAENKKFKSFKGCVQQ